MTLVKADKGLLEAVKHVGKQIDNDEYPYKVEKVLILPKHEEAIDLIEASDIIKMFNSSSHGMVKVLKDNGFGERDFDYFVYSGKEGESSSTTHIMPLNYYITLI